MFDRGFKTSRNRCKHEAAGRVLLLFRGVWRPRSKHDARVFDVASKTIHTSLVIRGIVSVL